MSRHAGRRRPPKPEQEAYVERLKSGRRRATRRGAGAPSLQPVTMRRRWTAVALSTVFVIFCFYALLFAFFAFEDERTGDARNAMIVAGVLGMVSLFVLGTLSRAARPVRTMFLMGPVAIAAYFLLLAAVRDPATPLVAALGVTGAVALRPAPGGTLPKRITFVFIGTALVAVGARVAPPLTVSLAPLLPFLLPMVADILGAKQAGLSMEEADVSRDVDTGPEDEELEDDEEE
jgi:hypothetical protein